MTSSHDEPRLKAVRRAWGFGARWPASATAGMLVVAMAGVAVGALYWTFHDRDGFFPRHQVDFPAPPKINAALTSAEARLKENPQDIAALIQLGMLHFEKGKESYIEAINELEEARDLGALDSRIFYCLGTMYQEMGLYPFALDEYKRFLRNHPEDKEVRLLLAKLLYQQKRFPEAVAEYERLKYHFPKDQTVEENLGLSLWGVKSIDRAVESFNLMKGFGPEAAKRAEFYLAQIAFEQGQFQPAVDHLLAALPDESLNQDIGLPPQQLYAALGTAYQKLKRNDESRQAWEKALHYAPGDSDAQKAIRDLNRRAPVRRKKTKKS